MVPAPFPARGAVLSDCFVIRFFRARVKRGAKKSPGTLAGAFIPFSDAFSAFSGGVRGLQATRLVVGASRNARSLVRR